MDNKIKKIRHSFISDENLLVLWKLLNITKYSQNEYPFFTLQSLCTNKHDPFNIAVLLRSFSEYIDPPKVQIYKGYKDKNPEGYARLQQTAKDEPTTRTGEAAQKILDGKVTWDSMIDIITSLPSAEANDHFLIEKDLPEKTFKFFEYLVTDYLSNFINGNTRINYENKYQFTHQKNILLKYLRSAYKKFGKRFIVSEMAEDLTNLKQDPSFLLIHTLLGLEQQDNIAIEGISLTNNFNVQTAEQGSHNEFHIHLDDYFIRDEVANAHHQEKNETRFDKETGILHLYGEKITFTHDQLFLMKTIFSDPERLKDDWFFSEISRLFDHEEKAPDKKFYNAAYAARKKIATESIVKDFLITDKEKVRINPEYLT
jgi:hypothetical protein